MRRPSWFALLTACVILCLIGWGAYQGWSYLSGRDNAAVPPLLPDHEEVAWFSPATSGDTWERLVAALRGLEKDWASVHPDGPQLKVSFQDAFLNETASVPQIALYFAGHEQAKLWLRWYKLSGEIQQRQWLDKLHKRGRPPLAIIGGDSSDQALSTARELRKLAMEGPGKDWAAFLAGGDLRKAAQESGDEHVSVGRLGLVAMHLKKSADQLVKIAQELTQEGAGHANMADAVKQLAPVLSQLEAIAQGKGLEPLDADVIARTEEEVKADEKARIEEEARRKPAEEPPGRKPALIDQIIQKVSRTEDDLRRLALEIDGIAGEMHKASGWNRPLFLVSFATVDRFDETGNATNLTEDWWPKFIDVYRHRTFRFCFTNEHIARSVLDFVQDNPQVWRANRIDHRMAASLVGQGHALGCLGTLARHLAHRPVFLSALAWDDDRYSQDLANRMWMVFGKFFYQGDLFAASPHYHSYYVNYSVGGFYQPNPREQQAVRAYLDDAATRVDQNHLLAVPTGVQPARRFLRTLCRQAPVEIQDLVVITGDSINFNHVYRDGNVVWNVLDLPVSLVFFSHRNPIDAAAGFRRRFDVVQAEHSDAERAAFHTTGTQDLLLLRDLIEALVQAAWENGRWSADPDAVRDRLKNSRWHAGRVFAAGADGLNLFDEDGNRRSHTGEHMVWLQPTVEHRRNLPRAQLSVWRIDRELADVTTWQQIGEPIVVHYNQAAHGKMDN